MMQCYLIRHFRETNQETDRRLAAHSRKARRERPVRLRFPRWRMGGPASVSPDTLAFPVRGGDPEGFVHITAPRGGLPMGNSSTSPLKDPQAQTDARSRSRCRPERCCRTCPFPASTRAPTAWRYPEYECSIGALCAPGMTLRPTSSRSRTSRAIYFGYHCTLKPFGCAHASGPVRYNQASRASDRWRQVGRALPVGSDTGGCRAERAPGRRRS